jgi:hypothetical protein
LYPVSFLILFVAVGTVREIVSKKTNELIIYNTPGSSTIGIRTGKILNLFTDTLIVVPEVKRHCASLGLKIKSTLIGNNYHCIIAGGKKILITNFLNTNIIHNFVPDYLVLTGPSPGIQNDLNMRPSPGSIIISSEPATRFRLYQKGIIPIADSIHYVRNSGAFVKRI